MIIIRKFFTVLASVIFFGNSLVLRQWVGTAFVFAGKKRNTTLTLLARNGNIATIDTIRHKRPMLCFISGIFLDGLYGKQKKPEEAKTSKE